MAYEALYRKYRPRDFDDVVGQKVVVQTLKNSVNNNKIAHAYLFSGPRGTGKTSIAKILASAINCEHSENVPCMECETCLSIKNGSNPDVIEMDAASNRGIDDIRSLIEKVKYLPLSSKYKVYIIDEVHMLTNDAFNALLKTLEEPPRHVIFILATTEPNKILPTIISRCQRYNFARVDNNDLVERLVYVLDKENIDYEVNALRLIAQLADGGVRDALSILDQCIAYSPELVSEAEINQIYGTTTVEFKIELINKIYEKNISYIVNTIRRLNDTGIDIRMLTEDLLNIYKEEFAYLTINSEEVLTYLNIEQAKGLRELYNVDKLMKIIEYLMDSLDKYSHTKNVSDYFEVALLKIMAIYSLSDIQSVNNTKVDIENRNSHNINNKVKTIETPIINVVEKVVEEKADKLDKSLLVDDDTSNENLFTDESQDGDFDDEDFDSDESLYDIPVLKHKVTPIINKTGYELVKYEEEFYLSLLAGANKEEKNKVLEIIDEYKSGFIDFTKRKYSNSITDNEIAAVSDDMLLIVTDIDAIANQINEKDYNFALYRYLNEELFLDRMVYAIDKKEYDKVLTKFVELYKADKLPTRAIIERYNLVVDQEVVETVENKLYKYFDEVEIKEN